MGRKVSWECGSRPGSPAQFQVRKERQKGMDSQRCRNEGVESGAEEGRVALHQPPTKKRLGSTYCATAQRDYQAQRAEHVCAAASRNHHSADRSGGISHWVRSVEWSPQFG